MTGSSPYGTPYQSAPGSPPSGASQSEEIQRLRDLLPASLRSLVTLQPAMVPLEAPLRLKRSAPWRPDATLLIDFSRWQRIPQPQRDLLFLREVGWFDTRNWLRPGLYQIVAAVGGVSVLAELASQNFFSVLLAGGVAGLAVRQVWQDMNSETAQLDADEFALRRAQFRGYDRSEAARQLALAIETTLQADKTDIETTVRLQRLQAIARGVNATSSQNFTAS